MSAFMVRKANLLHDAKSILGEGPVWDHRAQRLFWVDIEGYGLHQYDPSTEKYETWHFDEMIGAAVPAEYGKLLLAMEKGLALFDMKTAEVSRLRILENSDDHIRFNDGKIGPDGAFWIGTMDKNCAPKAGNLFRVTPALQTSLQVSDTSISNGLAWTSDYKIFYYIDSASYSIQAFDFNLKNGTITNGKTIVKVPETYGSPDGMCIDEEDMLWVAHWGGNCVRRWNPKTGAVLATIEVPAPHVTSCCFGGKHLNTLYITTARSGLTPEQHKAFPKSGGLFSTELDVKGTPIHYFNPES